MDEQNVIQPLLPEDKTFRELLLPFLAPYFLYVAIESIPAGLLPVHLKPFIKFFAVGFAIFWFRHFYRIEEFSPKHAITAALFLPVALFAWMGPLFAIRLLQGEALVIDNGHLNYSTMHIIIRSINTVFLVAFFEEIFIRVYLLGWFHQAGTQTSKNGTVDAILETFEQSPRPLSSVPLSRFSIIATTIVFTAGHQIVEYLPAILYFSVTTWFYKKTGSMWGLIIIHGLTNLAIAILALKAGMPYLW